MAERVCQHCGCAFYRAPSSPIRERVVSSVTVEALALIVQQAPNYCEDCLDAVFPGMVTPLLKPPGDDECGGGRWVNPNRGKTR